MVAFTPRLDWPQLPDGVRAAITRTVTETCGARVVGASSLRGGFSPGAALRLELDGGPELDGVRRVFVKATNGELNPDSPWIYRREAEVARALPRAVPAAALIATVEHESWVALVFDFVEGRLARFPWTLTEFHATAEALGTLARSTRGVRDLGIPRLGTAAENLKEMFGGWGRLAVQPSPDLPVRVDATSLDRLASDALAGLDGDHLVHLDVRPDNVLIGEDAQIGDHRATIVDWPWAVAGPPWLDTLLALISVRHGEFAHPGDGDAVAATLVQELDLTRDVDPELITGTLAGMAGFFLDKSREPAPPGLPTLRAFQLELGLATLEWVLERRS